MWTFTGLHLIVIDVWCFFMIFGNFDGKKLVVDFTVVKKRDPDIGGKDYLSG
jgi:hypothetical protein